MRIDSDALAAEAIGCRTSLSICCGFLILICYVCALYVFAPMVYVDPEVQQFLDGIGQYPHEIARPRDSSDRIAIVCDRPQRYGTDLYSIYPDGTRLQLISSRPSEIQSSLDWSPDGLWLALRLEHDGHWTWSKQLTYRFTRPEVYMISFDGSVSKRLTYNHVDEENPRWSSDGESVLFDSGGLHSVSAAGGEIKQINQLSRGSYSLSPSGLLLSIMHNRTGEPSLDYSLHRDDIGLKLLVSPQAALASYNLQEWSRNDEAFSYEDGRGGLNVFNMNNLAPVDLPRIGLGWSSLSPNGKWMASLSARDVPADGEWITLSGVKSSDRLSRGHLYLLDLDTGLLTGLVKDVKIVRTSWSPDSKWIAFVSNLHHGQLFKIKRNGTGLQQLTDLDCRISEISWSPK